MMPDSTQPRGGPSDPGHEADSVRTRAIVLFLSALVVGLLLIQLATWLLFGSFERQRPVPRQLPAVSDSTSMTHWQDPPADLARTRAREEQHLQSYEWIDASTGKLRIPIERAMELIAREASAETPRNSHSHSGAGSDVNPVP